jgi:hypothetical protein
MKNYLKHFIVLLACSMAFPFIITAQLPSYIPTNGLAGWWSFSGNAIDQSSYNANGTVYGATLTTDRFENINSAYFFDGIDDYIMIGNPVPTHLQIQNEITLSAWIYVTQYPTISNEYLGLIVGSQCDACVNRGATIFLDGRTNSDGQPSPSGHIHFQIGSGSNWQASNTQSQVPLNQWVHIVATRKANENAKIYYNGVLQPLASAPWNGTISYLNAFFAIGKQQDRTRYFNGKIDDVGVWNRALDECEVQQLYSGVNQYPTIDCPYIQTRVTDSGFCSYTATGNEFDATFIDDCPATVTLFNSLNGLNTLAGYEFSPGTTGIVWQLSDGNGLYAACYFEVNVVTTESPGTLSGGTIVCSSPNSTELVLTGYNGTISEWQYSTNGGETWNSIAHTYDTLTVTNITQATLYRVKVDFPVCLTQFSTIASISLDYQLPIISCVPDRFMFTDTSVCGYTVKGSEFDAGISDNCPGAYIVNNFNGLNSLESAIFPVGTTNVVWNAYDAQGNWSGCSFNVVVEDNKPPVIIAPPDVLVFTDSGLCGNSQVVLGDLIGHENCGITYMLNDAPVYYPVGMTVVTWTAGDMYGNVSEVQQTVTVIDNIAPVPLVSSLPDITSNCQVTELISPLAFDNCSDTIAGVHDISLPITEPGTTIVTWTYDDGNGNITNQQQNITVLPHYEFFDSLEICNGEILFWRGNYYENSGIFYDSILTIQNCDSIFILILTVNPSYEFTENIDICPFETFHWRGNIYNAPGTYYDSFFTQHGCDSVYVLHLAEKQCQGKFCDWQQYRKITVNNQQNSENLTDYTVLVTLNTASLIAQSKVKPDGSDIRFTTNFYNDLEYWIEPGIQNEHGMNDDSTHIWIKIPFIPASDSLTLYMFYGNPNALPKSNITTTFLFGDDFDDNIIDTTKWNTYIYGFGQIIEQNHRLEHNSPKSNPESGTQLFSKQSFTGPVVVDIQFKKGGHLYRGTGLRLDHDQTSYSAWMGWQDWGAFGPSVTINSITQNIDFRNDSWSRYNNPEYYLHIYRKPDSTFRFVAHIPPFEQDGYKYWQHTFTTAKMPLDQPLKVGSYEWVWKYAGTMWIRYEDNIRIRKYTEPEPYCQLFDELPVSSPANLTFDTICEGDSIFWRENYYSSTGTYTDSLLSITGCDSVLVLNLTVKQPLIPIFGAVPDLCAGDPVNPLPAFSENGIEGTWLPAFDNTQTTMYVFTPQPGQCAVSTELSVTVFQQSEGGILSGPYSEICTGESIGLLSISNYIGNIIRWERSDDGGVTWMNLGNISSTYMEIPGIPGTRMYRVVIQNNPCDIAYSNILTIIIHPLILPLFDAISPVCEGDYISPLPVLSNNGITGSWSPAPDNMQTTLYTFASDPGQCAVNTQITIEVNPVYLFETDIELCSGDTCFWRGNLYNQPGVYYDSLHSQHGCDSIYFLSLSFNTLPIDISTNYPILYTEKIPDGNTIVLDHLNNSTTGQLYGALSYVQSVPGLSIAGNFSSGQWIRYGYNANLRDAGTFDMWIYPTSYSTPLANINYSNTATTYPGSGHVFHLDLIASGKISMGNWPGTGLGVLESNSVIPLNQWTHIAVAWGDSTIIYINGKIDNSNPGSFRPSAYGNYSIRIPKWGSIYPVYIDEIHVSNKRRTLEEIRSGYIYYRLSTDSEVVCSGNSANIYVENSQNGVQYELLINDTLTGQTQEGNGSLLTFSTGTLMHTTSFKIKAENISTGCSIFLDTVITITLSENYFFIDSAEICSWQTYVWYGQSLNAEGTYYDNHTTANGCDSIYILNLSHRIPVPEICNDIDDDCDGMVDEGVQNIYYTDNDGDGYGTGAPIFSCFQPDFTSTNNTDCDDNDDTKHEGIIIYQDADDDGYHVEPAITICMGDQIPPGYKLYTLGIDCNDQNPNIHPGATELCNDIDDNCNGIVDEILPTITYCGTGPCSSTGHRICVSGQYVDTCITQWNAATPEICNGIDDDCDGQIDEGVQNVYYADNDGDGYGAGPEILACSQPPGTSTNNFDCDDTNHMVHPGAPEICGNSIDDNCDGHIDECFTLTVSKQGTGGGNVSTNPAGINCGPICSFSFPAGTIVTVQATPDAISDFSGWNGACTGTGICQITMDNNKQISALFTKKYFNLTITKTGSGNGQVQSSPAGIDCGTDCSENYAAGSVINLNATPYGSAVFTGWGGAAASCGTSQSCQLNIYSNMNVTASFDCLIPAAAGTISGLTEACPDGSMHTYSVPPVTNATTYVWNLPSGCMGSSSTNSINVIFTDTAQSGIISVFGQNECADGEPFSLPVNVMSIQIAIQAGSTQLCEGESVTIQANTSGGTNNDLSWFVNNLPLSYGQTNKTNQVLYCPLNGNANDISGNGIHGMMYGAVPTTDRFGNPGGALYFNGNSSYIDLGDHDSLNLHFGNMSISAWAKKSELDQHSRIYSKGTHGGSQPGYDLMFYGWGAPTKAACIFAAGGQEHIVYSNVAIADTNWHHYVGIIDRAGYVHLYVDGIKQNDSLYIGDHYQQDIAINTLNAAIGASYSHYGMPGYVNEFVNGSIDEVILYKRILTPEEVLELYNYQGQQQITFYPYMGDQINCVIDNDQMCSDTSNVILFNVHPLPDFAGIISGPDTVFAGQTAIMYSIPLMNNATSYIWTLSQGITGMSNTNSISVDILPTATSESITVRGNNSCGNGGASVLPIYVSLPPKHLQLKVFLEGLYNSQSQLNEAQNDYFQPQWGSGIADVITVELYESNQLYTPAFSKGGVPLDTYGYTEIIEMPQMQSAEYYIVIKHRNSIETWSAMPVSFSQTDTLLFDFTLSASQAYMNNLQSVSGGFFAIFGGDVNQDGIVDGSDMSLLDNAVNQFMTGYVEQDINGDGLIDGSDMALIDNNSTKFVHRKKP